MIERRALIAGLLMAAAQATARPVRHAEPPEDVVRRLYRDFAWEAVMGADRKQAGLLEQPLVVLRRYFTETLARLLAEDARCARRTGKLCRIDFLPLWDSQDPAASDLVVSPAKDGVIEVAFSRLGGHDRTRLSYRLAWTAAGWRIADIASPERGWSLMTLLTQK
jgi:hypothetical protein